VKHKEELAIIGIGVLLFAVGVVVSECSEPPLCVQNTLKAVKWAEESLGIRVACGGVCVYAVNQYLEAHNLTPEEFPTCCWSSDGNPPMSLGEKVGFVLTSLGILAGLTGVLSLTYVLLKAFVGRVEDGRT